MESQTNLVISSLLVLNIHNRAETNICKYLKCNKFTIFLIQTHFNVKFKFIFSKLRIQMISVCFHLLAVLILEGFKLEIL